MKRIYGSILTMFALGIAAISIQIKAMPSEIFIENNYGAKIKFKFKYDEKKRPEYLSPSDEEEREVSDGQRKRIERTVVFQNWHPDVLIRTTGAGSGYGLSPYTSIKPQIEQILKENKSANKAIIQINKGTYLSPWWDIKIKYE